MEYVLGLRRLGWDVTFLDTNNDRESGSESDAAAVYLRTIMERFGHDAWHVLGSDRQAWSGRLSQREVEARVRNCALLINVNGFLSDPDVLALAPRTVFLDIDPGFGQMWRELGLADVFRGHDEFVTIAENIGQHGCEVPTCGLAWTTTRQPVVLDYWPVRKSGEGAPWTTVGAWRGPYDAIDYGGKKYGLRAHEFRQFAQLPRLVGDAFELALDIDPADSRDMELLSSNGWSLVDPRAVAADPWAYQAYIASSKAEFGVAKNIYVATRGGWFSDRSICYLASGKPVVIEDTALGRLYPVGEGLLTFATLDEARAAVEEVSRNYERHSRAARAIAEEYFDSDKVLTQLLAKLGVA